MTDLIPHANEAKLPNTTGKYWIRAGIAAFACAGLCILATVVGMMWSYRTIATANATPKPSDLAANISNSLIPSLAVVPLIVIGTIFLLVSRSK